MVRLRYRQVKIPAKLLHTGIVVRMNHSGRSHIGDSVIVLQYGLARENHIFVKNCFSDKSPLKPEFLPVIGAAHIGSEKCFDSQLLQIRLCFQTAFVRIIESPGIPLRQRAVLIRKLSGVSHNHRLSLGAPLVKGRYQLLYQMLIRRYRIVRHKQQIIRPAVTGAPVAGISMIELLLSQMMNLQTFDSLKAFVVPKGSFRIHHNNPVYRVCLKRQHPQKPGKLFVRPVNRDNHIHTLSNFHSHLVPLSHVHRSRMYTDRSRLSKKSSESNSRPPLPSLPSAPPGCRKAGRRLPPLSNTKKMAF